MTHLTETKNFSDPRFGQFSYKSRGLYAVQLRRYCRYFDHNQIFILSSDELMMETKNVLKRLFSFLGVDHELGISDLKPRHVARNKTPVTDDVYSCLEQYFLEPNLALYDFVGKDFEWRPYEG